MSHAAIRRETLDCGEHIDQFHVGWFAGTRPLNGAKHLHLAIDSTVFTAVRGKTRAGLKFSPAVSNVMKQRLDDLRAHSSARA
jgi:hypothetical protein